MNVVVGLPPIWDEIVARFPAVVGRRVYVCWNETVFTPIPVDFPPPLVVHEGVHCRQQAGRPEIWWRKYLDNQEFRLEQEVEAYRAQFAKACENARDRNHRRYLLNQIVSHLSGPIYGHMITADKAKRRLTA